MAQAHARILGVKVDSEKRDFHLIRTQLAEETGNDKVTVPTLKVGDEYITDSWVIAEWVSWSPCLAFPGDAHSTVLGRDGMAMTSINCESD